MAAPQSHNEVEFVVEEGGREITYRHWRDAVTAAAVGSAGLGGEPKHVDVLIYGESGARWWGGDDAVESYRDDPDASVHERFTVSVESLGRIA